jgi:hypothetical protein
MMAQFQLGEDLFATVIVVGLTALLVIALVYSYHNFAERKNINQSFDIALDVSGQLRDYVLAKHDNSVSLGLINPTTLESQLQSYFQLLSAQGIELSIEVRGIDGKVLLAYGSEPNTVDQYFSPQCSVSLPVAVFQNQASNSLGELIVNVWR